METFEKHVSTQTCSGKEIGGLPRNKKNDTEYRVNCCMNGYSRAELEVGMKGQGLSIARDESKSCYWYI